MHATTTERHVEPTQLRLGHDFGICSQQTPDSVIKIETNLQMPVKNCINNQQRRGRRRREQRQGQGHGHGHGNGHGRHPLGLGGSRGLLGIFCLSINLGILIGLAHSTNAVPTDINSISSISSSSSNSASSTIVTVAVTPSSINSSSSSSSSNPTGESLLEQQQPQGQCLLDGLWVSETMVRCEKQASCRAIQRTGHCCPDYKCDCEKDGKTYANGYKLVDPDTPCTVCYCKGGEIVCSSVTCFRRDDCLPKYVPGRCCPEYDNCPILDNNPPLGSELNNVAPPTAKPMPAAPPAGFNWNITIKEITKPTEIRITDDNHKVKQTIPTRKAPSTEAPSTAATSTTSATATNPSTTTVAATVAAIDISEAPSTSAAAAAAASATTSSAAAMETIATPTQNTALSTDTNPQKALPVNGNDSLKLIASVGYIERPLSNSNKHNNNIVGQPLKPLVSYTADGLQPVAENDPSKVNIKREYTTEGVAIAAGADSTYLQNGFQNALVENNAGGIAGELEPDTAGSDNIYHIISTTEGPSSGGSSTEHQLSTEGILHISEESSTLGSNNTSELESSTEGLVLASSSSSSSSESPASSTTHSLHHMEEDEVPQVESNPAYPSLPEDDFSLRDVNFPLVELEELVELETNKDEQRSIAGPFERDNKRSKPVTDNILDASGNGSGNGSGGGSGDTEFYQSLGSTTEYMLAQASGQEKVAMSHVPLMYSAEDNSAETRIQNVNELSKISARQRENETSGELDNGSGNGDLREPTTPRAISIPALDIDELGSGGGQAQSSTAEDPKADAESLKLDENQAEQADTVAKTNNAGKESARAEKSLVEQIGGTGAETAVGQRLERLYLQRIY
ncbi:mucin-5AC isoform X2 [Drosophila grimshawi]|uniref:GH13338 n=2 Tax=Drosophila grimshawi TaxID=7222 RepID=B4JPU1_DROGR|nr:mucin-5AC isoform X2 [Drosophila grimshawi]XP_032595600.1 mucin-5AC isoform X2 [Drosophila grimshawi]EDV98921.1 GH13338 [Drosophila grimshawi]